MDRLELAMMAGPLPQGERTQISGAAPVETFLRRAHAHTAPIQDGEVATYIPELGRADPSLFGLAIATVDGVTYAVGDADTPFTVQSISKPFMYGLALDQCGRKEVAKHVGVEPTGAAFNAVVFDEVNHRACNPMVNAGAIAVSALTTRGCHYDTRRKTMRDLFSRYAGRTLLIDESVFRSERATGERNRVIAALMRQAAMLEGDTEEILDLYFSQCSVLATCRDLALMAATLANNGVQPVTGERVLGHDHVIDVLTAMHSCGMYNYAGQWAQDVGIPAKSGVSGAIIGVIPGQMGLAVFSPRLDPFGNSVRGIAAFKHVIEALGMHVFRTRSRSEDVIRGERSGDSIRSKRQRSERERAVLAEQGGQIAVIETQGALSFGSTELLLRRIREMAETCKYIILDMRRVRVADVAAMRLIEILLQEGGASRDKLLLTDVAQLGPLADLHALIAENAVGSAPPLFSDCDAALEWCEDRLILERSPSEHQLAFSLAQIDVFRGLSKADLKALESMARPFVFEPGRHILKEGDPAQLFFVIASGRASVLMPVDRSKSARSTRIAAYSAGATLGEMALLDGGARSADVVADETVVCYGFSIEELVEFGNSAPQALNTIFRNLAADLTTRLRAASAEIHALKQ